MKIESTDMKTRSHARARLPEVTNTEECTQGSTKIKIQSLSKSQKSSLIGGMCLNLNDLQTKFHNAINYKWSNVRLYLHPPIQILDRVSAKMKYDKALKILIAPIWPGQSWYTKLKNLSIKFLFLGQSDSILEMGQRMKDNDQKLPPGNAGAFLLDLSQTQDEIYFWDRTEDNSRISIFNTALSINRTGKARANDIAKQLTNIQGQSNNKRLNYVSEQRDEMRREGDNQQLSSSPRETGL
ncbi:MAG: hypothetical protein EZS28_022535 [Streblomastix strix]|uniref:Uncharacterized protein n=1 Tax=Streblomastix strix TaxID=222440 RepID=A0A5J4VHY0_9EUKA|nr:MAG: hypothetical protein EZS28_022535 [Streblomastix strix]